MTGEETEEAFATSSGLLACFLVLQHLVGKVPAEGLDHDSHGHLLGARESDDLIIINYLLLLVSNTSGLLRNLSGIAFQTAVASSAASISAMC